MPLLTGVEGTAGQMSAKALRTLRPCKQPPAASTERPETSKEFAVRMRKHFILHGLKARKKGE
ncbi:hypothetical protein H0H92_002092, partial [Tricholoma furcatifolium]